MNLLNILVKLTGFTFVTLFKLEHGSASTSCTSVGKKKKKHKKKKKKKKKKKHKKKKKMT